MIDFFIHSFVHLVYDKEISKLNPKNTKLPEDTLRLGAISGYYAKKDFGIVTLDGMWVQYFGR